MIIVVYSFLLYTTYVDWMFVTITYYVLICTRDVYNGLMINDNNKNSVVLASYIAMYWNFYLHVPKFMLGYMCTDTLYIHK